MKQRLLVMNGQCTMQQEDQGQWKNSKVEKARGVKPGIYNIYTANRADKAKEHTKRSSSSDERRAEHYDKLIQNIKDMFDFLTGIKMTNNKFELRDALFQAYMKEAQLTGTGNLITLLIK